MRFFPYDEFNDGRVKKMLDGQVRAILTIDPCGTRSLCPREIAESNRSRGAAVAYIWHCSVASVCGSHGMFCALIGFIR
jgi:hypothetical protein